MRRRVLIIALHFPPAHETSTRRVAKFVRYLPDHGWESSVVTVRTSFYRQLDESAVAEVPEGTRVYRAFGFDAHRSLSVRGRYPGFLALPDRAAPWLPFAAMRALAVARRDKVDAIFSTSPPVTAQCVALLVQRWTGLPWVADFRDPWTVTNFGGLRAAFHRGFEPRVMRAATRIVVTTQGLADDLRRRFDVGEKLCVIPNGYDEADFAALPAPSPNGRFTIAHVGQLYAEHRDPAPLLQAVRQCLDRNLLPADLEVVFVGAGLLAESGALRGLAERFGIERCVRIEPHVDYRQALQRIVSSSALLLLQGESLKLQFPAKAYEYLRSGRRILVIAPAHSETGAVMRRHAGVEVASPSDVGDIAEKLSATYRAWQADRRNVERDLARYDRRALTAELAATLDEVCELRAPKWSNR